MKQILLSLAFVGFAVSSATAGCGKTVTNKGKLKSFNAETKALVVEEGGKEVKLTLTASAKGADGLDKLVGKSVALGIDASSGLVLLTSRVSVEASASRRSRSAAASATQPSVGA